LTPSSGKVNVRLPCPRTGVIIRHSCPPGGDVLQEAAALMVSTSGLQHILARKHRAGRHRRGTVQLYGYLHLGWRSSRKGAPTCAAAGTPPWVPAGGRCFRRQWLPSPLAIRRYTDVPAAAKPAARYAKRPRTLPHLWRSGTGSRWARRIGTDGSVSISDTAGRFHAQATSVRCNRGGSRRR
jgi:hypothetical protein